MRESRKIQAIFYVRGFNTPYNEGHIQNVKSIIKSLETQHVKSIIFNYRYRNSETDFEESFCGNKFEKKIPIVWRDDILQRSERSTVAYSSLMETLATPKFLLLEKLLNRKDVASIVNITNCFTYPRMLSNIFLQHNIVLHFYMRNINGTRLMEKLTHKAKKIIVSSETVAQYVRKKLNLPYNRIEVLYPPIDTDLYRPRDKTQVRKARNYSKEAKILLYMGNLRKTRFSDTLVLDALKELKEHFPEILLMIYAPVTAENLVRKYEIIKMARSLDVQNNVVIHVANLAESEKSTIYASADAFLFPSLENTGAVEPPLTVLEAMASGLPVLATNTLSLGEIIRDHENGKLIHLEDQNELIDTLNYVLSNLQEAHKYSKNARQTIIDTTSFEVSGHKLHKLYLNLLER